MTLNYKCNTSHYVGDLIENNEDDVQIVHDEMKEKVRTSALSKCQLYHSLNSNLSVHIIYKLKKEGLKNWKASHGHDYG